MTRLDRPLTAVLLSAAQNPVGVGILQPGRHLAPRRQLRLRPRKEAPTIIVRLVNTCWFLFKWSIALMLITVLTVGGYFWLRLDDEIGFHPSFGAMKQVWDEPSPPTS